jgi:hypothetical protein
MRTFDQATIDSTGAFLIGQLELLDRTIHEPLQSFTWSRDINVRSDVTMAHDFSSYTNQAMASVGGIDPTAKAFISKDTSDLPNVAIDIGKTASPLLPWGLTVDFSVFELESAMLLGQGIDEQKMSALRRKHQQDTDIMVYLGDTTIPNASGMLNSSQIVTTQTAAVAGASSPTGNTTSTLWSDKTPDAILSDVNTLLNAVWKASAYTRCPRKLIIAPLAFAYIASQKVSTAGNLSILQFLKDNSLALAANGVPLEIVPSKWCTGTNNGNTLGVNATDMMYAYTQEYDLIRFPMVPIMGLPVQFRGAAQIRPYVGKLGVVEFVYPETTGSCAGIG